jgi:hypothetical protein
VNDTVPVLVIVALAAVLVPEKTSWPAFEMIAVPAVLLPLK